MLRYRGIAFCCTRLSPGSFVADRSVGMRPLLVVAEQGGTGELGWPHGGTVADEIGPSPRGWR